MKNSRLYQLSNSIILEYIWADTSIDNEDVISTSVAGVEIMQNLHDNSVYFFNSPSSINVTNNIRKFSVVSLNKSSTKWATLDDSRTLSWNDLDPDLTSNQDIIASFSPQIDITYDTVRFHFISGLNFGDYQGYIFNSYIKRNDESHVNLLSIKFMKNDTPIFNPKPFIQGTALYSSYIEFKIPSSSELVGQYNSDPLNNNTLGYKIVGNKTFLKSNSINFSIEGINSIEKNNGFDNYNSTTLNIVSINRVESYSNLSAYIGESSFDYYEFYGSVNNQPFEDFMASLNSEGNGDWIAIHQIIVSEQISNEFIVTSNQMFVQLDNYQIPQIFRPVIMNSSIAASYALDYTLRVTNRNTGEQITKNSRIISTDVGKYGPRMSRINLDNAVVVSNVVNKVVNENYTGIDYQDRFFLQQGEQKIIIRKEFVPIYKDRINVIAKISKPTFNG